MGGVSHLVAQPWLALLALSACFALVRMLMPNIAGYPGAGDSGGDGDGGIVGV